jgi:hypothetical protein
LQASSIEVSKAFTLLQNEDAALPINDLSMLSEGDMSGNQHSIINSSPFASQIGSGIQEKAKEAVVVSFTPQQKEEALSELRKIAKGLASGSSVLSRSVRTKFQKSPKGIRSSTFGVPQEAYLPSVSSSSSTGEFQNDRVVVPMCKPKVSSAVVKETQAKREDLAQKNGSKVELARDSLNMHESRTSSTAKSSAIPLIEENGEELTTAVFTPLQKRDAIDQLKKIASGLTQAGSLLSKTIPSGSQDDPEISLESESSVEGGCKSLCVDVVLTESNAVLSASFSPLQKERKSFSGTEAYLDSLSHSTFPVGDGISATNSYLDSLTLSSICTGTTGATLEGRNFNTVSLPSKSTTANNQTEDSETLDITSTDSNGRILPFSDDAANAESMETKKSASSPSGRKNSGLRFILTGALSFGVGLGIQQELLNNDNPFAAHIASIQGKVKSVMNANFKATTDIGFDPTDSIGMALDSSEKNVDLQNVATESSVVRNEPKDLASTADESDSLINLEPKGFFEEEVEKGSRMIPKSEDLKTNINQENQASTEDVLEYSKSVFPERTKPPLRNVLNKDDTIIPSSHSSPDGEDVTKAIDGLSSTKYLNFKKLNTGFTVTPNSGPSIITAISITTANDFPERDPVSWQIFGTNDGVNFKEIAEGSMEANNERFHTEIFEFSNGESFTSYKIVFPSVADPLLANSMQVAEVSLIGKTLR